MPSKVVQKRKAATSVAPKETKNAKGKGAKRRGADPGPAPCKRPASSIGQKATAKSNSYELTGGDICGNSCLECNVRVELSRTNSDTSKIKHNFNDLPRAIYPIVFYPDFLPEEFKPLPSDVKEMNFDRMKAWLQNARSKGGLDLAIKQMVDSGSADTHTGSTIRKGTIEEEMSKVDAVIDALYALGGDKFVAVQKSTGTSKRQMDDIDSDMDEEDTGSDCDPSTYDGCQTQTVSLVTKIFQMGSPASKMSTAQLTLTCTGEVSWSC